MQLGYHSGDGARSLLEEFFPLGDAPEVETIRQRTMRVGARLERDAVAPPTSSPSSEAVSIALAIDGGHVKSVRSYQVRSFEVFVAEVSNDAGKRVMSSSVPAETNRQQQQLRGVLHRLGATPRTPVTILSDGTDGPRSGQAFLDAYGRYVEFNLIYGRAARCLKTGGNIEAILMSLPPEARRP